MENISVESVVIYSPDIEKTREFYEMLGFSFEKSSDWTSYHYHATLGGNISFRLHMSKEPRSSSTTLGFRVSDVPAILRKLHTAGAKILRPAGPMAIRTEFAERRYAEIQDPDGRVVVLYERSAEG